MRCQTCDYLLWDLKPGPCPECGEPFAPTTHQFLVGAVRFCCPHCDQSYYGDGEGGHLNPRSFDCVSCGATIDESECIVRPLEGGSREDVVAAERTPWFDPSLGWFKRFRRTVGMSMTQASSLGRGMPRDAGFGSGFAFHVLVHGAVFGVSLAGATLWLLMTSVVQGPPGGVVTAAPRMMASTIGPGLMLWVLSILWILVQGSLVHLLLRLSGPTRGGLGRTIGAIGFGTGPMAIGVVPFCGWYLMILVGSIWSLVSSVLILRAAQRVSALRASLSVLGVQAVALTLVAILVVTAVMSINRAIAGMGAALAAPAPTGPNVAAAWVGVDPLPNVSAAAMEFPAVFDAEAETIEIVGTGYRGWCQRRELVLGMDDGSVLQASFTPATGTCTVRTAGGGTSGVRSFSAAGASPIHEAIVSEIVVAGGRPDLSVDTIQRWIDLGEDAEDDG